MRGEDFSLQYTAASFREAKMRVSEWGKSLVVRLPETLVEEMGLKVGDELAIVEGSKRMVVVEKVDRRARFLRDMERFRWPAPEGCKFDRDEANER
jgi:antitoxin MazE